MSKNVFRQAGLFFCFVALFLFWASCEKEEPGQAIKSQKTLFMYLPWSSDLTDYFYTNISDMEANISKNGLNNERVIVFLSSSPTEATLFEITCKNGQCQRIPLKNYTNPPFTTAAGITSFLNDLQAFAPAWTYAMIIGCHGMGWLPVHSTQGRVTSGTKMHWEHEGVPLTRYFGGTTSEYQTDITTLATGIVNARIKMEYILFDDCYMSSIEVAYDLKEATGYLIGSTSEIMAYGMPYADIGSYLLGIPDYKAICDEFYAFYSTYRVPCGTLAVTNCSELDKLAAIMRKINNRYTFNHSLAGSLQRLDGYTPILFYDYGDYVSHLCDDPVLLNEFKEQLNRTVPYKTHTECFYSMSRGAVPIYTFSGITTSDPSTHPRSIDKTNTSWYLATH